MKKSRLSKWLIVAVVLHLNMVLVIPACADAVASTFLWDTMPGDEVFRWTETPSGTPSTCVVDSLNHLTITAGGDGLWTGARWNTNSPGGPADVNFRAAPFTTWFEASFIDTGEFGRVELALGDDNLPVYGWAQITTPTGSETGYTPSYWYGPSTAAFYLESSPAARTLGEEVTLRIGIRPTGVLDYWVNDELVYSDATIYTSNPDGRWFNNARLMISDRAGDGILDSVTFTSFSAGNGYDYQPPPVPEPASMGLLGLGLVGLVATRIRKRKIA